MGFYFFEKNKIICMLAIGGCASMMLFPDTTAAAAKHAVRIWMDAVVPSLLPFAIIASYIRKKGTGTLQGKWFYPLMMAFLSGYPMGAAMAGDGYRAGLVSEEGLRKILTYSMITGPAFLVGSVGIGFYQNQAAGYILAFSHYGGAVLCGLLLGREKSSGEKKGKAVNCVTVTQTETLFSDCILEGFQTIGMILAYMMLFMIGADFIDLLGIFQYYPDWISAFSKGLLEMTVGCSEIAACTGSATMKLVLSSFVVSFGGLSVLAQTMTLLQGCPVSLWNIMKIKVLHGVTSGILTFTICTFVV